MRDLEQTELRVPIAEERVEVQKRSREIGEVLLRRSVTSEHHTLPVELRREILRVTRRDVPPRPAQPAELEHAFTPGIRRVPVLGESAVAVKRPFVTGEVVVHRRPVVERTTVNETVRRAIVEPEVVETTREHGRARDQGPEAPREVAEASREVVAAPLEVVAVPVEKIGAVWREVKEGFTRGRQRT